MDEPVVLGSLSIFDRVFLGLDGAGAPVNVVLAERNLLVGGEPGAGKSVALNLIVAVRPADVKGRLDAGTVGGGERRVRRVRAASRSRCGPSGGGR